MRIETLGLLLGISSLLLLSELPNLIWALISLAFVCLLAWKMPRDKLAKLRLFIGMLFGFALALWKANLQLAWQLPQALETKTLQIIGTIVSIPEPQDKGLSFEFELQQIVAPHYDLPKPIRIRLSWHHPESVLHVGEQWSLQVRLKRPHGYANPGSFNYEKWLFEHQLHATGYVVAHAINNRLSTQKMLYLIDRMRESIAEKITQSLAGSQFIGLITALAVGIRYAITPAQWQVMQGTGTNHLMAIAGLHIGFMAGLAHAVINFIWRRCHRWCLYWPAQQAAAAASLLAAMVYSALAGFALPTQRAVIMLAVFLVSILGRRNLPAWTAWSCALLFILLLDPLATLSDSFWLSFGAVAIIIYGSSGRLKPTGLWWKWGHTQWVVAVGLIPLTLLFFHQTSLIGFFANAIAIPWVGFLVLPLSALGGLLMLSPLPGLGHGLLYLAEQLLAWLWPILEWLAKVPLGQWSHYILNSWILVTTLISVLLLLAPRGFPGRWLSSVWALPVLLWVPAGPAAGEVWFSLLDVGQGLAAVIRTQQHVLVFDTGPHLHSFDAGHSILVPFLKSVGIAKVDRLVISHPDNDHRGGADALIRELPVQEILSSVSMLSSNRSVQICQQGQTWDWDDIHFEFLYPPPEELGHDNNSSCVLRVVNGENSLLLTGDIEKYSERYLLTHNAFALPATILIAPHHGSRTSSTASFIAAVNPRYVLFPIGYRNRYRFPSATVVARYQAQHAQLDNTADSGLLQFVIQAKQPVEAPMRYRILQKHFWND